MKYTVKKGITFDQISKYLSPVVKYGEEKQRKNIFDDWDEFAHTASWLEEVLEAINKDAGDVLDIYYLEKNDEIIGVLLALSGSLSLTQTLASNGVALSTDQFAHLTCFHITEAHRGQGVGRQWLEDEVFSDLKSRGIQKVYIKSSHHKALPLYQKLGTVVGNYISVSDHEQYQRYGYIFEISL